MTKVFVSYSHNEGDWVRKDLVPCLQAGGCEVLIDHDRFQAGQDLLDQMNAACEEAEITLLILSPAYLKSTHCIHEMNRAVQGLTQRSNKLVIPVKRVECPIPQQTENLLYVNLCRSDKDQWDLLLRACNAHLGVNAADWLKTRDTIVTLLRRHESINLVVHGNPKWYQLIEHIRDDYLGDLGIVDLDRGVTASRAGLVGEILRSCGVVSNIPVEPQDLVELDRALSLRDVSRLALLHTDHMVHRRHYGIDLFQL